MGCRHESVPLQLAQRHLFRLNTQSEDQHRTQGAKSKVTS